MKDTATMHSDTHDYYGLKLLISLIILLLLLAYTSFYLIQNYYSKSFLEFNLSGKKIYFLESNTLKNMYKKNGMDYEGYKDRVKYFKELALKNSYESQDIYSNELKNIDKNSKLIVLDVMSLSTSEIEDIDNFVSKGGRMIFNFTSGFLSTGLKYQKDNLVSRITKLSLDEEFNTVKYDKNTTGYLSTKLLSPLSRHMQDGDALELVLYDPLPVFDTPDNLEADSYITNWSQTSYLNVSKNREFSKKQSGAVWHGYKDRGKWVYFSFPSYAFIEVDSEKYANLFKGMLEYLDEDIGIAAYPYIDAKNIVFVSEDTEYKFKNFEQFYTTAEKNHFPVTAFCVAYLADKNRDLMKKVSKSKYVEIGSHSYSHKKIVGESDEVYEKETQGSKKLLDALSKQKITGFRPPREEMDEKVIDLLEEGGYKYILAASDKRLSPYFTEGIMIIPRHGTDDYSYLINLDWNASKILQQMEHEVNVVADLNGIYSMSTHTHLMSFSTNISITDDFFHYINTQKHLTPMNGKMLYDRIFQKTNMTLKTNSTQKKFVVTITNDNREEVKNIHYEIYVDSATKIKNVESEIIGVKTELIKKSKNIYILIIKEMKAESKIVLFLNYEKNS